MAPSGPRTPSLLIICGAGLVCPGGVPRHSGPLSVSSSPLFFQVTHTVEPGSRLFSGMWTTGPGGWRVGVGDVVGGPVR